MPLSTRPPAVPFAPRDDRMGEITRFLQAAARGEAGASEELLPLVYDDLRRHAASRMARESGQQTLQPTALVHEAWLRVMRRHHPWDNRGHFFSAAAEAMRRILIENARRKARLRHGGDHLRVEFEKIDLAATTPEEKVLLIDEALAQLEQEDPEKARVVVLKFFGGHRNQDVAELLSLSERTVERHWAYAKAWLFQRIREQS
jgi:RNA polymerase sigma factor (TIGR02999 family)